MSRDTETPPTVVGPPDALHKKQQSRQARLRHRLNLLAMTCKRAATESAQHLGITECWCCILGAKFTLAKLASGTELRNGWG